MRRWDALVVFATATVSACATPEDSLSTSDSRLPRTSDGGSPLVDVGRARRDGEATPDRGARPDRGVRLDAGASHADLGPDLGSHSDANTPDAVGVADAGTDGLRPMPLPVVFDRDLDGISDRDDRAPDDPYGARRWTPARSSAHREVRTPGALTTSWDGLIVIGARVVAQESGIQYEYVAQAFRPQALSFSSASFSPAVAFDPPDATRGNLHLAIFPDSSHLPAPAHGNNPYRSNAEGAPDSKGTFRTYKVGLIGVMESLDDSAPHHRQLTLNHGTIVVGGAFTAKPHIHTASVDGRSQPLTTTTGEHLYRYEPTVSLDGRLVIWSGMPQNRLSGAAALYSFNPNPMRSTGWSTPRNVSAMYWTHGPGSARETLVEGVPFSERYPIAKRPLRMPDGRVLHNDDYLPGPYPWLSFDASELFVSTVAIFSGPGRSGSVVVGARTNWIVQHIDSAINPSRSTLSSDDRIHFTNSPEGALLNASYRQHTLGDGTPLGVTGHQRILASGLLLSGSMWTPFLGQSHPALPFGGGSETYGILTSTRRYVEVPLPHVVDGHYLVALPMNEQLRFDAEILRRFQVGDTPRPEFWNLVRKMVTHDPRSTPDVSGNLQTGRLFGAAAFPFEYHKAQQRWNDYLAAHLADPSLPDSAEGVSGDTIDGMVGNAIYFPGGAGVQATLRPPVFERLRNAAAFSVQLWVKPLRDSSGYNLFVQPGLVSLRLDPNRHIKVYAGSDATPVLVSTRSLPIGRWSHVALAAGAQARLLIDGEVSVSDETRLLSGRARSAQFIVGPADAPATTSALCLIDEFSMSDVERSQEEIRRGALRRPRPRRAADLSALNLPRPFANAEAWLPDGARITRQRIALGEALFSDPILSRDRSLSCATCHQPSRAFTDGRRRSIGINGQINRRNAQTLINRLFGRRHFWDGRAVSLEQQVLEPIKHPAEMDLEIDVALRRLADLPSYRSRFLQAFAGQAVPTPFQLATSLASYLRSLLVGSGTAFDQGQLSSAQSRGRALFFGKARCSSCHNGPNFSDEAFHNVGLDTRLPENHGRFAVTGRGSDLGRFKTPTLRQLSHTAPYFHDGRFLSLDDVIAFYNRGGDRTTGRDLAVRPLGLNQRERGDLRAFLESLSSP